MMDVCLLLDLGLKAAFEFKGEVVVVDRDPLDQPPDEASKIVSTTYKKQKLSHNPSDFCRWICSDEKKKGLLSSRRVMAPEGRNPL